MNVLKDLEQRGLKHLPVAPPMRIQAEAACVLLAEDRLKDYAIANEVGVTSSTISAWKKKAEFQSRIMWYRGEAARHIYSVGLGQKENRVAALAERWRRMHSLIEARARAYGADPKAIGGNTGLIVKIEKVDPKGGKVISYEFDAALDRALRDTEKQAAIELGQWTEKRASLNVNVETNGDQLTDEQHEAIRKFLTSGKSNDG